MQHTEQVREYYDHNTARFLKLGKHRGTQNIHQALWAEGVQSPEEAVSYSNRLVLEELEDVAKRSGESSLKVLDLGCGVGSSILYLARNYTSKASFTGITLSSIQAEIANERKASIDNATELQFLHGDFLNLPDLPAQHLAFAIEAFVHAADPRQFFEEASKVLGKGGKLVLIDDFLAEEGTKPEQLDEQQRAWLQDFRAGWLAQSLISLSQLQQIAGQHGFTFLKDRNLTPYMEIGRLRDQFIGLMIRFAGPAMRRSTYFKSLTGGYAKQQCLKTGLVSYRQVVLRKEN